MGGDRETLERSGSMITGLRLEPLFDECVRLIVHVPVHLTRFNSC